MIARWRVSLGAIVERPGRRFPLSLSTRNRDCVLRIWVDNGRTIRLRNVALRIKELEDPARLPPQLISTTTVPQALVAPIMNHDLVAVTDLTTADTDWNSSVLGARS
jgi:hypothetical protein